MTHRNDTGSNKPQKKHRGKPDFSWKSNDGFYLTIIAIFLIALVIVLYAIG